MIAAAVLAVVGLGSLAYQAPSQRPTLQAASIMSEVLPPNSTPAPDFSLRDQNNEPMSIRRERGKVVMLTFLYSQCRELCPIEADQLAQVQSELGSRSDLVLLIVSVAPDLDTRASVMAFAKNHHWTVEWYWALGGRRAQFQPTWRAYGIDSLPKAAAQDPSNVAHSGAPFADRSGRL